MRTTCLHVLTPQSAKTPELLVAEGAATADDLVADLRLFPCSVFQVTAEHSCRDLTAVLLEERDYWAVAREWLIQLTARTGLQDLLAIDGYGFWWTLNSIKFVPALTDLGSSFAWIDLLDAICRHSVPEFAIVHGGHEAIARLVSQACKGATVKILRDAAESQRKTSLVDLRAVLVPARVVLSIAYLFYSFFRRPQICFFSDTNLLRLQEAGSRRVLQDVYLGPVIQTLRKRGWRAAIAEKYGPNASWRGLLARGFFFPTDIFFVLSMPVLQKLGLYRRSARRWRTLWKGLRSGLLPHLRYKGYDMAPLVEPLIEREFSRNGPGLEVLVSFWRRLLALWRPRLLFINCYYGRSALPAIVAAKSLHIPTVEQQHGVISKRHNPYMVPRHLDTCSEYPLCDLMLAWGEHPKRLLVEAGVYQPEQVAVCGSPRTDLLLGELPPRSETLRKLGIPATVSVVLYTSNLVSRGLMSHILDSIQTVSNQIETQWIVKLHPREKTCHEWEAAIEERQLSTVKVVGGDFDFYALLAACDIHVSFSSTTVIEAAILGKLNLVLNLPHVPDPAGYAEVKGLVAVAPDQLGSVVHRILADPEERKRLLREQRRFADDWCLHDGHAVDRIVAVVESIADGSGRNRDTGNWGL